MLEFDSARNALKYLIKEYKIKEIYIPYYLCDVIRHSIVESECKPIFYHIDDNFMPSTTLPQGDYILYPNYFGICGNNVYQLTKIYPKLIVDNAHAFYAQPSGFASFNSAKKFMPGNNTSYLFLGKEKFMINLDYERRKKFDILNQEFRSTNLLKISISSKAIPFCYPYLAQSIEEADELVQTLNSKGLTIYRYWKSLPKTYNEYKFYSRLVPIPLG